MRRIEAIDLLRGLVIVLMALDHVRDFFGPTPYRPEDLTQSSAALFLTRWVTHFCAPVFVFLAGLGARLYREGGRGPREVSAFLAKRGFLLIVLELTVINLSWLMIVYSGLLFVQVIWVIGVSMLALALLSRLPRWACWTIAVGMIAGHNLLDPITPGDFEGAAAHLWGILHVTHWIPVSPDFGIYVVYPLIPWIGVMLLGWAFGDVYIGPPAGRRKRLLLSGAGVTAAFLVLRAINTYGDPWRWAAQERGDLFTVLSFLNTQKYPPSLLFLAMTLGPALLLLGALDGRRLDGRISAFLLDFGRVPLFFYLLHIPFIHLLAAAWSKFAYGRVGWWFQNPQGYPAEYEPGLLATYGVWIGVTLALWPVCRSYAAFKRRHDHPLLRYL